MAVNEWCLIIHLALGQYNVFHSKKDILTPRWSPQDSFSSVALLFSQKRLQHEVMMHPENFGRELQQKLRKRLCEDVEGTVPETTGIIVAVLRFYDEQDVKRGLIEYETGYASFIVNYEAIIYRPFKNQVLDAKVRHFTTSLLRQ